MDGAAGHKGLPYAFRASFSVARHSPSKRGVNTLVVPARATGDDKDRHYDIRLLLLEISQIGRRLVLLRRHQEPIGAEKIVLLADDDLVVALGAIAFGPGRVRLLAAAEGLVDAPGPRQRMIEHRDLVMQNVRIVPVEMEPLHEGRFV